MEHLLFAAKIEFDLVNTKYWPETKDTEMSAIISTLLNTYERKLFQQTS